MLVELIKYCSFGYRCPVAIMIINNERQVFTKEGISSLIKSNRGDQQTTVTLKTILARLEQLTFEEIEEINWDDLSGQSNLF